MDNDRNKATDPVMQALFDAGLSECEAELTLLLAEMPEDEFIAAVESDSAATVDTIGSWGASHLD